MTTMPSTARSDLAIYEAMRRALLQRFGQRLSQDEAIELVVPPNSKFRWALRADWRDWEAARNAAVMCGNG